MHEGNIGSDYLMLVEINPEKVYEIRNHSDAENKLNNMYDKTYNQFLKDYVTYYLLKGNRMMSDDKDRYSYRSH